MRLQANMSGVDKSFGSRERAEDAKEPELGGIWVSEQEPEKTPLGAENYMNKGRGKGWVVATRLVMEKALLDLVKGSDKGSNKRIRGSQRSP